MWNIWQIARGASPNMATAGAPAFFLNAISIGLDGTNDCVGAGDLAAVSFERTDAFSAACWVATVTSAASDILGKQASTNRGWGIRLVPASTLIRIYLTNTTTTDEIKCAWDYTGAGAVAITDGAFHHIAITYDGGSAAAGLKLYVDGSVKTLTDIVDNLASTIDNTDDFCIGGAVDQSSPTRPLVGNIDEIAVWDLELSAASVTAIYNNGVAGDIAALAPLLWYRFDGDSGTTVTDHGSGGNNGTVYGGGTMDANAP